MQKDVILAGFGGQGVLFAGKVLSYCGLLSGLEVSWLPSYGPEMRGGTANCSVCISDEPVGSPLVTAPDILICMNQPSYDKFISRVKPGGIAVLDRSLVLEKTTRTDISAYYIPASDIADSLNSTSNMVLLGKLFKETGIFDMDIAAKAIEKSVPERNKDLIDANINGVQAGWDS